MKPIIICIVGQSGSGKTYMSQYLEKTMGIKSIVSYTDRPIRNGEIDGVDHWFVSTKMMNKFHNDRDFIAYTRYGDYQYGALHSDIQRNQICSYVIDEAGLKSLSHTNFLMYQIIPVYIKRNEENRHKSGVSKERIKRDNSRKRLPEEFYDCIIENNGTIEEFNEKILKSLSL